MGVCFHRRLRLALPVLAAVGFLSPLPARADVVVLEDGETIEGIVKETGTQVIIELDVGTITLERSSVKEIRKTSSKLAEFRAKRERIRFNDVRALFALSEWAAQEGLSSQAQALCREILKVDENHLGARSKLGYRKHDGRWLTEDEYMEATGHVRYGGTWMMADEARRLEAEKKERAEARAKEERLAAMERSVAQAQREAAEAKDEAERARQEAESAKQNRWLVPGGTGYWPYNPYPRVYPNVYPTVTPPPAAPRPRATPAAPAPRPHRTKMSG